MSKFSKADLVDRVLELDTFETKKAASETIELIINTIKDEVISGSDVNISGLGIFRKRKQAAKQGNVNGNTYTSPEKYVPKFTPSAMFKEAVAQS